MEEMKAKGEEVWQVLSLPKERKKKNSFKDDKTKRLKPWRSERHASVKNLAEVMSCLLSCHDPVKGTVPFSVYKNRKSPLLLSRSYDKKEAKRKISESVGIELKKLNKHRSFCYERIHRGLSCKHNDLIHFQPETKCQLDEMLVNAGEQSGIPQKAKKALSFCMS
ncbi:hypothetical protein PanWU01x14_007520 [Parasponia andersonii]|uniref:Uncharacterized protein n=1 Tax=Parasponia andersonii TaxID=3476 RepID=A0A2P5E441_PARAD|nr:hypothetical protein PanWU01x14_007520 [Parasponia andersonii]